MEKNEIKERMLYLYKQTSKHSQYQSLSSNIVDIIGEENIEHYSKNERARMKYILSNLNLEHKRVLDIGGNTGYFTFESINYGAQSVDYYEGNKNHAEFVSMAAKYLQLENRINVYNEYYDFINKNRQYDVALLLNVVHHFGDDYGNGQSDMEFAKEKMIEEINNMAQVTDCLIFQMGFNWKGDRNKGLFEHGTKKEMIEFIRNGILEKWECKNIGIAGREKDDIRYKDLDEDNIMRDNTLGEFLNRPIFILQRK